MTDRDVRRLEAERLRPVPPNPAPGADLWRQLLDLISGECRRKGWLPRPDNTPRRKARA